MSRIRKDSALRAAEGDRGNKAKKGKRGVPEYDRREINIPGAPERPAGMSKGAIVIWHKYVPILARVPGLLNLVDGAVLADFCEVNTQKAMIQSGMAKACTQAAKDAKTAKRDPDAARAMTMVVFQRTLNQLRMRESVLRKEIGMCPLARTQIKLPPIPIRAPVVTEADADAAALDDAMFAGNMVPV